MKKYWLLVFILFLGICLRFYQLGQNPPSLDWDEASMGYNAYSILKTGADEFGRKWPVSIRSFEDYKPAIYVYLAIPGIYLFGLNEFSTRLPAAIVGSSTLVVVFFLVREFIQLLGTDDAKLKKSRYQLALSVTLLMAISPWHLQFSRIAFESNIGLGFVLAGVLFFLKGLKNGKWFLLSAILWALSFYSYHSPRLVVPLLVLGWTIIFFKKMWQQKWWLVASFVLGAMILLPFVNELVSAGKARFTSVTVINPEERLKDSIDRQIYDKKYGYGLGKLVHNRRIEYSKEILNGYLDHFNFDFLFLTGDAPGRHHPVDMGMLYIWEALFILVGIWVLARNRKSLPLFWWFLVAPAASALTTGTPHAVRALLYLPTWQIFTSFGLWQSYKFIKQKPIWRNMAGVGFAVLVISNMFYYLNTYYIHTPVEAAGDWQYGYKQAVAEIKKYESVVDKVIMTYVYDQPHVFVLFYQPIDPVWYQAQWRPAEVMRFARKFGKYEFRMINWEQDSQLTNTLIIGTAEEIPSTAPIVKEIKFPNGSVAFRVVKL